MIKKSVSIIIPNYNGQRLLERFLPFTIAAIKNAGVDYEIIVIDDASKDESVAFMKANYPEIILLQNEKNSGFSVTCNVGIAKASKELMLILNSDIKLNANYFDNQWQCFADEDTFGVMGRILENNSHDGPRLPETVGLKYRQNKMYSVADENIPAPTVFLSGANALVCSKKMKQIGGFDEIFTPFYYEDTELSLRVCRLGWKCYYDFKSTCDHLGSSTVKSNHHKRKVKIIYYRNRFLLHAIHLNKNQFWWFKLQIFFLSVIPNTFIGKLWMWKSFIALKNYKNAIKASKERINQQANITGKLYSVFSLRDILISALEKSNRKFKV